MRRKKKKVLTIIFVALAFLFVSIFGLYCYFKALYPMKHSELIAQYAAEYEIDPYLAAAVIWKESRFREDAVSGAGAMGLMQVMPETGQWICQKMGRDDYAQERLFEPEYNIRLGCWYLSYLDEKFVGDPVKILAGYNAGPNRVIGWLENPEYSSDGKSLEKIPFAETDNYVKKVQQSYEIYRILYKF